jgi:septal ring factor EnvC (AmiA/AmiB activator)
MLAPLLLMPSGRFHFCAHTAEYLMSPQPTYAENEVLTESACRPDPVRVNSSISATLRSDYEALRNDVQQANELAAEFQRQLSGKSNDFAQLKQLFEKTQEDLSHLNAGIAALREERHRLANEAMKGEAYKMKLASVTNERARLRIDLEVIRNALAASKEEMTRCLYQRDKQIAELTVENTQLKHALLEARRRSAESAPSPSPAPAAPKTIYEDGAAAAVEIAFS